MSATVNALGAARAAWRTRREETRDSDSFPSRDAVARVVDALVGALYPRRLGRFRDDPSGEDAFVAAKPIAAYADLEREVAAELGYWQQESSSTSDHDQPVAIVRLFGATLPDMRELGAPIVARVIAEIANERTGIDIHPGATIGRSFFIDHGTGVVIGETAIVGDRVRLYQHVTLGARSALGQTRHGGRRRYDRHPIAEDDVVIYAGATILGRVTIGARSTIGGNVWLLSDVPSDSLVVQPEARPIDPPAAHRMLDELVEAA